MEGIMFPFFLILGLASIGTSILVAEHSALIKDETND